MLQRVRLGLSILVLMLCACGREPDRATFLVLDYGDFGPQVIASEVIGMQWWQWQSTGDPRPREYDIKVVVYRDRTLEQAKESYPVDPARQQDYRYVEYTNALEYLDRVIQENVIETVTEQLEKTRAKIVSTLGD
jgi:hypothetical protein